jgi:hypothetical protein
MEDGFLVSLRFLAHNNKPNCQGIPAEFVATHVAPLLFVRPVGDKLEYFMLGEQGKPYGSPAMFRHIEANKVLKKRSAEDCARFS